MLEEFYNALCKVIETQARRQRESAYNLIVVDDRGRARDAAMAAEAFTVASGLLENTYKKFKES